MQSRRTNYVEGIIGLKGLKSLFGSTFIFRNYMYQAYETI